MDVGDSLPTIDPDAVCFGPALCSFKAGSFGSVDGGSIPCRRRILDTRVPVGITNGPCASDGRLAEPDITGKPELVNHELQVTGVAGVRRRCQRRGAQRNVTAGNDGFLSAYRACPACAIPPILWLLDDQSSFLDGYRNCLT
jgi:hypothetical protein